MEEKILEKIRENIGKVMIGNEHTTELVLTCMLLAGPCMSTTSPLTWA